MNYEYFTLTNEEMQKHANGVLQVVINGLVETNDLNVGRAAKILEEYSIVVEKSSWLPPSLQKLLKMKEGAIQYRLVRVLGRRVDIDYYKKEEADNA